MFRILFVLMCSCVLLVAHDWKYHGDNGPSNWGNLDSSYILCKVGNMQSPINISKRNVINKAIEFSLNDLNLSEVVLENNGYTLQFTPKSESTINFNDDIYSLQQFHFHTPSEHKVDGNMYSMEIHFVYKNKNDEILVMAAFVKRGSSNATLETIIQDIPKVNKSINIKDIDITELLPQDRSYFQYIGSLTTPPCTQNVQWIVLKKPINAQKNQIDKIHNVINDNARPTQELNYRKIS